MKKFLWMATLTLLVSGCGELSYKRGASTQDLEAAKKACQSAGSEKAADQCLQDRGWTVKKLDDVDLFATAGVSPDNRNPSVFTIPAFVPVAPAQPAAVAPSAVEPAVATAAIATATSAVAEKPAVASKAPVTSVGTVSSSAPPQAATPTLPAAPPVSASPQPSPLDIYTISSWWKIGADREALAADTNECVAQLGEAHKPNAKTQQVTRGFVVCMHDKGWKALRAVAS